MNFNYVLLVLTTLLILSRSADSGDDANCMLATPENECLACSRGFHLNTQGFCTPLQNQNDLQNSMTESQMVEMSTRTSSQSIYDMNCWVRDKQGTCIKCYEGYIFKSKTNQCFFVGKYCRSWNQTQCLSCMRGAQMTESNQCVGISVKNCERFESGQCKQCEYRYVLLSGVCNRVDDGCQTWDKIGNCISCFNGFVINKQFGCQLSKDYFTSFGKSSNTNQYSTITSIQSIDTKPSQTQYSYETYQTNVSTIVKPAPMPANCDETDLKGICSRCSLRFYFSNGKCEAVSQLCRAWSLATGACTDCYDGYYLFGPACVKKPIIKEEVKVLAPDNCLQYSNGECKKCAFKFYISKGKCSPVSDLCKAWRMNGGQCVECFEGYVISNGNCILKPVEQVQPKTIPNCALIGSNGICMKCAFRYYSFNGDCVPVSDLCKSWNDQNGACTQCYDGYVLNEGECSRRRQPLVFVPPPIIGCVELGSNGYCFRCAIRYILKNGYCQEVSNLCKNWQPVNGGCTQCYDGYNLKDSQCIIAPKVQKKVETTKVNNTMAGCAELNQNGNCKKCIFRYVNINGKCKAVSDQCKDWSNKTADCTECFDGYSLKAGVCAITQQQKKIVIPGCAQIGPNGNCQKCAFRYYFKNRVCVAVSDQCKTWNELNGACTDCYPGYSLSNSDCIAYQVDVGIQSYSQSYTTDISASSNCVQIGITGLCKKCASRFINWNGLCRAVSDQCKTWNQLNGACTQCFKGYLISNFDCVPAQVSISFLPQTEQKSISTSTSSTSSLTTQGETKYDPTQFRDIQSRFAASGGIEGCLQVNQKGACKRCEITHIPWKGVCRLFPRQCKSWDGVKGVCSTCIDGYLLSGLLCIPAQNPLSSKTSTQSRKSSSSSTSTSTQSSSISSSSTSQSSSSTSQSSSQFPYTFSSTFSSLLDPPSNSSQ